MGLLTAIRNYVGARRQLAKAKEPQALRGFRNPLAGDPPLDPPGTGAWCYYCRKPIHVVYIAGSRRWSHQDPDPNHYWPFCGGGDHRMATP